ncbi:hypothetical protein J2T17_004358 [Paenibacillus mucilaginosus]|uniref:glycoside hydrolase family 78 protein n=1 Tax=Paenibacillus mucilaginosus TaxID=61624 RepID=UPI003D201939
MRRKHLRNTSFLLLCILIFQIISTVIYPFTVLASTTKRLYVNWDTGQVYDTEQGWTTSSGPKTFNNIDLKGMGVEGVIETCRLIVNGAEQPSKCTYAGTSISLTNVDGQRTAVHGRSYTDPGHHTFLLPNGDKWEHKAKSTPSPIQFVPDSSTFFNGLRPSTFPGKIPLTGQVKNGGTFNYKTSPGGIDLRYSYGADSTDRVVDYRHEGSAVTAEYEALPPKFFYLSPPPTPDKEPTDNPTPIASDRLIPETVTVTGAGDSAKADFNPPMPVPYAWGKGTTPGTGMFKVLRMLTGELEEGTDYINVPLTERPPYGFDRNYWMQIDTTWQAETYIFSGYIDVTYKMPQSPDLAAVSLKTDKACFAPGDTVKLQFSYQNFGPTTDKTFHIQLKIDGTVYYTDVSNGAVQGEERFGQVDFKFSSLAPKQMTLIVDSNNVVDDPASRGNNVLNQTFTPVASCAPGGGPEVVKADFTIQRVPSIKFGDDNAFIPDIEVTGGNGCSIQEVFWTATQGSKTYNWTVSQEVTISFAGPPYPGGIGAGMVSVTMKLTTTCGTVKEVGPKSFQIIMDANNNPPVFSASFFDGGNSYGYPPIYQVTLGSMVDLGIVHDPTVDPNTPYDPDGDGIIYTWDFENSPSEWLRNIAEERDFWEHDEHFRLLKADVLGTHRVNVSAIDTRGGDGGTKTVTLEVVPPNPIPIITLPPKVIEGRPFTPDISCANSYSPAARKGVTIRSCEWTGKQTIYPDAGDYPITLHVTDSNGLKSLNPAVDTLKVLPDLPPIAEIKNPGVGVRNTEMNFQDTSYSPDGDPILTHTTKMAYDSDNDGSFDDETFTDVALDLTGAFTYTPTKVGKYRIDVFIQEALGYKKSASTSALFEVVNEAPEASFYVQGSDFQPPEFKMTAISSSDLAKNVAWKASSINGAAAKEYYYDAAEDALAVGAYPVTNNPKAPDLSLNPKVYSIGWSCPTFGCGLETMIKPGIFLNGGYSPYGAREWTQFTNVLFFKDPANAGKTYKPSLYYASGYNQDWRDFSVMGIDQDNDLVWLRDTGTYDNGAYTIMNYYDVVFRISTIESNANTGNVTSNPLWSRSMSTGEGTGYSSNYQPPPPPATVWKGVPDQAPYRIGDRVKYSVPKGESYVSTAYGLTEYGADYAGNTYKYLCTAPTSIWTTNDSSCTVQKYNSDGNAIWAVPIPVYAQTSYSYFNSFAAKPALDPTMSAPGILYVSKDNSKIVIGDQSGNKTAKIYDNNTGAYIKDAPIQPFKAGGAIYDGKIVGYMAGTSTTVNKPWYVSVYDIERDATHSSYWNDPATPQLTFSSTPATLISGDGKILVSGTKEGATALYVYDMQARLLGSIALNLPYVGSRIVPMGDGLVTVATGAIGDEADNPHRVYAATVETGVLDNSAPYSFGQLYNPANTLANGEISMKLKFNYEPNSGASAGISARMVDNKNMYTLEVSETHTRIVKVVDGVRTVLKEAAYPIDYRKYYDIKLKMNGSRLKAYVGGIPLIDVEDATFTAGMYGPYVSQAQTMIKAFVVTEYIGDTNNLQNVGVVGTELEYVVSYSDLEKDPAILEMTKWSFSHINPTKFLDAGDGYSGLSAFDGQTVTSPHTILDKVGVYKIDYQVPDDPAPAGYEYPDETFAGYRKYSDVNTQYVTIHRRPISLFSLAANPDYTIAWTDSSYDPDRWLSASNYSTEATGIDYQATRGIMEYKRHYVTPSGQVVNGQLTRPKENGVYTVRQAVKDEYGVWSDWYEVMIDAIAVPNAPPGVYLTKPDGTQAVPNYVGLRPTITWDQSDIDPNTTFSVFDLTIKDEAGAAVITKTNMPMYTTNTSWSWDVDTDLQMGKKYQVQVRVSDGTDWSNWSNIGWMQINTPPSAVMTHPNGTQSSPTVVNTLQPLLTWRQTDPDPGAQFDYFQIQITNEANDTMILDSGKLSQLTANTTGSWQVNQDLPTGQKLRVRVKVWDQFGAESNWSEQTWMIINRAPIADFTWNPNPAWEGDTISLVNLSYDPDGDSFTSLWEITGPNGYSSTQTTHNATILGADTAYNWGDYEVRLTVTDIHNASDSIAKTVLVGELTITGHVNHTPTWELNRQAYNLANPGAERSIDTFFAGEQFDLVADTTDTGNSSTVAGRVQVSAPQLGLTDLEWSSNILWNGFFNSSNSDVPLETLPEGPYDFVFTVLYTNGILKEDVVRVYIVGKWTDYFRLHRQF